MPKGNKHGKEFNYYGESSSQKRQIMQKNQNQHYKSLINIQKFPDRKAQMDKNIVELRKQINLNMSSSSQRMVKLQNKLHQTIQQRESGEWSKGKLGSEAQPEPLPVIVRSRKSPNKYENRGLIRAEESNLLRDSHDSFQSQKVADALNRTLYIKQAGANNATTMSPSQVRSQQHISAEKIVKRI